MSYRTMIEDVQIFGNNESYPEWIAFLEQEGITIDDKGHYDGKIYDFMSMLEVLETIVFRLEKERQERIQTLQKQEQQAKPDRKAYFEERLHNPDSPYYLCSIFDFQKNYRNALHDKQDKDPFGPSLFDELSDIIKNSYCFLPYQAFIACRAKLELCDPFSTSAHFCCYQLKPNKYIRVKAR